MECVVQDFKQEKNIYTPQQEHWARGLHNNVASLVKKIDTARKHIWPNSGQKRFELFGATSDQKSQKTRSGPDLSFDLNGTPI